MIKKDFSAIAKQKLINRGVNLDDIANLVFDLQKPYCPTVQKDACLEAVENVLAKREVAFTILTGIELDMAAEKNHLNEMNQIILDDYSLYGIDEIMALSIVNVHGSIALTNFGYLDKTKPGIVGFLEEEGKKDNICHTFLDDIVCAIASSAASKIAHDYEDNKI